MIGRTPAAEFVRLRRGDSTAQLRNAVAQPAGARREFLSAALLTKSFARNILKFARVLCFRQWQNLAAQCAVELTLRGGLQADVRDYLAANAIVRATIRLGAGKR